MYSILASFHDVPNVNNNLQFSIPFQKRYVLYLFVAILSSYVSIILPSSLAPLECQVLTTKCYKQAIKVALKISDIGNNISDVSHKATVTTLVPYIVNTSVEKRTPKNVNTADKAVVPNINNTSVEERIPYILSTAAKDLVPNIVHYISFSHKGKKKPFIFINYLSIISAHKYIKPDHIYLHTDSPPEGMYWNLTMEIPEFEVIKRTPTKQVFGK